MQQERRIQSLTMAITNTSITDYNLDYECDDYMKRDFLVWVLPFFKKQLRDTFLNRLTKPSDTSIVYFDYKVKERKELTFNFGKEFNYILRNIDVQLIDGKYSITFSPTYFKNTDFSFQNAIRAIDFGNLKSDPHMFYFRVFEDFRTNKIWRLFSDFLEVYESEHKQL